MVQGTAAYVLPRYVNKIYIMLEYGEHFGHVDLAVVQDMLAFDVRLDARALKRRNMVRRFTVQAIENCETFVLRIDDLEKMKMEFPDMFVELFEGAHDRLQRELLLKLDVIKKCEAASENKTDIRSRLAAIFNYGFSSKAKVDQNHEVNGMHRTNGFGRSSKFKRSKVWLSRTTNNHPASRKATNGNASKVHSITDEDDEK